MSEEGAEEARRKKLEELQKRQKSQENEEKLKTALRVALTEDAYERLMNIAFANKEVFAVAAQQILAIYQKARRKLSDKELVYLLQVIQQHTKRETRITFMKK